MIFWCSVAWQAQPRHPPSPVHHKAPCGINAAFRAQAEPLYEKTARHKLNAVHSAHKVKKPK